MNARNDFLVALVTFLGTMIVVTVAWIIYGTTQNSPPPLQSVANVSDPSRAIRSKPGPNGGRGVDLAAARARIDELEKAIADRDARYAKDRKNAQAETKSHEEERKQLLEDMAFLQGLVSNATAARPRKPEQPTTDQPTTDQPNADQPTDGEDATDPPLESPLEEVDEVGAARTIQAEEDLRDLEARLERYIERLSNSSERLATAAQSVVVQAGESSVDGLIGLLDSEDPMIQLWALQAIRQIGPMAGEAELAVRALRDHPLPEVAQAAAATLRQILD